jgi:hypothetical protein
MMVIRYALVVSAAVTVFVPAAIAQEQPASRPELFPADWTTISVVDVAHVDAASAAAAIRKLGMPVAVGAISDSKLVLRGTEEGVGSVVKVLDRMDMPESVGASRFVTEFLPLGNIRTHTLMSALSTVTRGSSTRVAVDEVNRMLVARGSTDVIGEVRKLLTQLDKPAKSLTLQFFFIRASVGAEVAARADALPDALSHVGKTLAANGFGSPSLMAPIIVVAEEGEEFESESRMQAVYEQAALEESLVFEVSGQARVQSGGEHVHLSVHAAIRGDYVARAKGADEGETHFDASTTIAAKLGSYVILAAAPSSTAQGDTIALVVRVTAGGE